MITIIRETSFRRWALITALVFGVVERVAWAGLRKPYGGETYQVARSLALGRGFSDALRNGQPTAHLTPGLVLLGGVVYRWLGYRSAAAEAVLLIVALATVIGVFLLCSAMFRKIGLGQGWATGALCFLLVAPIYTSVEAVDFRLWEGALASLMSCSCLFLLIVGDGAAFRPAFAAALSFGLAITFLVSPTVGAATYAAWLIWLWRNRSTAGIAAPVLTGIGALMLVLTPWTIRNEVVLHRFIPTRDNIGLEMSLSFYEGADQIDDNVVTYWQRLLEVHPFNSSLGQDRMIAAGGEVPYNQQLLSETESWIRRHPAAAVKICLRHVIQYAIPPVWQFMSPGVGLLGPARWLVVDIVGALGFLAVGLALTGDQVGRTGTRVYLAVPALMLPLVYMLVHPIPRYIWLDYPLLVFWSALLLERAVGQFRKVHSIKQGISLAPREAA